jgi:release factor glutamine methyltransferase
MRVDHWLAIATKTLSKAGISTVRLDSLVLLEDVMKLDRSHILAHSETRLSEDSVKKLNEMIKLRINHVPLAYIRGKSEFYGREFVVSPDTLEPRPETETIIDLVKGLNLSSGNQIADVGAGSGAIGVTLALELPTTQIDMYEINEAAIKIVKSNIRKLKAVNCHIYKNDLLADVKTHYDVIVANLPYVPDGHTINQAAMQEPKLAIFGGSDGLDIYRRLFLQIANFSQTHISKPRYVLTESLPFQHLKLKKIAQEAGYKLIKTNDFIQRFSL